MAQSGGTVKVRKGLLDELYISEWQETNGRTYFKFNRDGTVFSNSSNDTQAYILAQLKKNGPAGRTLEGFYRFSQLEDSEAKTIEIEFLEYDRFYTGYLFSGQDFLIVKLGADNEDRRQKSPNMMFMRYHPEKPANPEDLYPKINGYSEGGKVPASYFTEGLEIKVNENVDVVSFEVITVQGGKKVAFSANGNQLTDEIVRALNSLQHGTYITIHKIVGKDKQGNVALLKSLEYMIIRDK